MGRRPRRAGLGPTLIEWVTYRVAAHSTSDDPSAYRADELATWPLGDPIDRLRRHLSVRGALDDAGFQRLHADVEGEVLAAEQEAESHGTLHGGDRPSPAAMFDDVYEQMPAHLRAQREAAGY